MIIERVDHVKQKQHNCYEKNQVNSANADDVDKLLTAGAAK